MANLTTELSTWNLGTADSYSALSDGVGVNEILSSHFNGPASAIIGLQGILGSATSLRGSRTDLASRLATCLGATGAISGGSAFPTSPTPVDGQLFWRTDLKQLHLYDGALAQWQRIDGVNDHGNLGGLADNDHAWAMRLASGITNVNAQITHANTALRTITLPDASFTVPQDSLVAHLAGAETLSGPKTLTTPILNTPTLNTPVLSGTATGTYTLGGTPTISGTVQGNIVNTGGIDAGNNGVALKIKVIDIGDWNMDSTGFLDVPHGLTQGNIRHVSVVIRTDSGTQFDPLDIFSSVLPNGHGGYWGVNGANIRLTRTAAGWFDSTNWDSTSYNRGWIVIDYV